MLPLVMAITLGQTTSARNIPLGTTTLGQRTIARVSDLVSTTDERHGLLLSALDNATTPEQALAVNTLLGVNFIVNPLSARPPMSAASGMCRLGKQRPWDFPTDHGLHCNQVQEWFFFVGTFDVGGSVVGYELMLNFQKLAPSSSCTCDYADGYVPGGPTRLSEEDGRLVEVQFAVVAGAKQANGSAAGIGARQQAPVLSRWWTGLQPEQTVEAEWGFRVSGDAGSYLITAETSKLNVLQVVGTDISTGLAINLTYAHAFLRHVPPSLPFTFMCVSSIRLHRNSPFMLQGGSGYIGDAPNGNGMGYYSASALETTGTIKAANGVLYYVTRGE